jgi:membrane associated rhomboid family serine protease
MKLSALDSPGGQIAVCLTLVILGAVFSLLQLPEGKELIIGGSSALFAVMRAHSQYIPQSRELLPPTDYLKDESR